MLSKGHGQHPGPNEVNECFPLASEIAELCSLPTYSLPHLLNPSTCCTCSSSKAMYFLVMHLFQTSYFPGKSPLVYSVHS